MIDLRRCPRCDEPVVLGESYCWYCGATLDVEKPDKLCPTCGIPNRIARAIHAYLKTVRRS